MWESSVENVDTLPQRGIQGIWAWNLKINDEDFP